jgi:hypothetical protein
VVRLVCTIHSAKSAPFIPRLGSVE